MEDHSPYQTLEEKVKLSGKTDLPQRSNTCQ